VPAQACPCGVDSIAPPGLACLEAIQSMATDSVRRGTDAAHSMMAAAAGVASVDGTSASCKPATGLGAIVLEPSAPDPLHDMFELQYVALAHENAAFGSASLEDEAGVSWCVPCHVVCGPAWAQTRSFMLPGCTMRRLVVANGRKVLCSSPSTVQGLVKSVLCWILCGIPVLCRDPSFSAGWWTWFCWKGTARLSQQHGTQPPRSVHMFVSVHVHGSVWLFCWTLLFQPPQLFYRQAPLLAVACVHKPRQATQTPSAALHVFGLSSSNVPSPMGIAHDWVTIELNFRPMSLCFTTALPPGKAHQHAILLSGGDGGLHTYIADSSSGTVRSVVEYGPFVQAAANSCCLWFVRVRAHSVLKCRPLFCSRN